MEKDESDMQEAKIKTKKEKPKPILNLLPLDPNIVPFVLPQPKEIEDGMQELSEIDDLVFNFPVIYIDC